MLYEKLKVGVPLSGAGGFLSVSSSSLLHAPKMKQHKVTTIAKWANLFCLQKYFIVL